MGIVRRVSLTSYRKQGIINPPDPPCPLDGPVPMEGVRPNRRVQSKLSDLDCCHLHKSFSKLHDGSEKCYIDKAGGKSISEKYCR